MKKRGLVGMTQELSPDNLSVIWGSLRNHVDFDRVDVQAGLGLVGSRRGEFPVFAHHPIFLEMPRNRSRQDISGRFNSARPHSWGTISRQDWSPNREIQLPVYACQDGMTFFEFKCRFESIVRMWHSAWIPDNIPCAAVGVNVLGNYSDEREAQNSSVLLLWANGTATHLQVDWFQGPLEDCVSPEWYMRSSSLLPWPIGLQSLGATLQEPSRLENAVYSAFVQPSFMGHLLSTGERETTGFEGWEYVWRYFNHDAFVGEMQVLLSELSALLPAT